MFFTLFGLQLDTHALVWVGPVFHIGVKDST